MLAKPAMQALRCSSARSALRGATRRKGPASFYTSARAVSHQMRAWNESRRPGLSINRTFSPQCRRAFFTDSLPPYLVPPVVFFGLLITLWTYKSMMMVLFQDKIIYMPYMPPFARSEITNEYIAHCKPVQWEEKQIKSLDGTRLSLCIGKISKADETEPAFHTDGRKEVVICYFQGNGGSLPPRLPLLSSVLKSTHSHATQDYSLTLIALSYRGYWTSSGRASQSGIEQDAQALLEYVKNEVVTKNKAVELILWGQSIGAGVASTAAAAYISQLDETKPPITGIILETPFSSVKSMLIALYPQKWLPYRYLSPFLWNRWDTESALTRIAAVSKRPKILLLPATRDEVVPPEEADKLERLCTDLGLDFRRKDVAGALHNEATVMRDGQSAIAKFVVELMRSR